MQSRARGRLHMENSFPHATLTNIIITLSVMGILIGRQCRAATTEGRGFPDGTINSTVRQSRVRRSAVIPVAVPVATVYAGASSAAAFVLEYGYDQMDQTIYPTIYGPIVAYRRRYGYRHGPYYGYGVYVDVPPFYGYGDVRNGFGIDQLADLRAAAALSDGRIISGEIIPRYGHPGT